MGIYINKGNSAFARDLQKDDIVGIIEKKLPRDIRTAYPKEHQCQIEAWHKDS